MWIGFWVNDRDLHIRSDPIRSDEIRHRNVANALVAKLENALPLKRSYCRFESGSEYKCPAGEMEATCALGAHASEEASRFESEVGYMHICNCGRAFEKAQSLNAHYGHCSLRASVMNRTPRTNDHLDKKRNWNRGLTKSTSESVKRNALAVSKARIGTKLNEAHKRKLRLAAKRNGFGGFNPKCNAWKKFRSTDSFGNDVHLDSSYEQRFTKVLNALNVKWIRCPMKFKYKWNGEVFRYYPDFYLPDFDWIIEVKGLRKDKDLAKWSSVKGSFAVIQRKELELLETLLNMGLWRNW